MKRFGLVFVAALALLGLLAGLAGAAERSGGTFNFVAPYDGDLATLDPHKSNRVQDYCVSMNIHRGLFRWSPEENRPVPALVEKFEVSADGLTYKLALRKGAKFHNGREVKADDVIWSYTRIMAKETAAAPARYLRVIKGAADFEQGKAQAIAGLKKVDDYTLEITTETPLDLSYILYEPSIAVLPKEEVEKRGAGFGTDPVGCGPFTFVKWTKGSEVVLKKFPDYYEKGKPYLDKVVYKIMNEASARDMAFKAKDLDATIVGSAQYPGYKADPEISKNLIEVAEMFTRVVIFNTENEIFKKKELRQAINYAVDTPLIISKLLKGKAFECIGYLPPTSPAFNPKAKPYRQDLAKAKELMKKAGLEKGLTIDILATNNEAWGIPAVEAMMPMLKEIGITLKPVQVEGAVLADNARKGSFQAVIWSLDSGPDPMNALRRWKSDTPRTAGNYAGYKNPEFDKLLEAAAKERDQAKKLDLLRQADGVMLEDPPVLFYNYNKAIMAHQPWVHGLKPVAPEMMFQDVANVWIDEKSPRANEK